MGPDAGIIGAIIIAWVIDDMDDTDDTQRGTQINTETHLD
jgi:hypothetical protein